MIGGDDTDTEMYGALVTAQSLRLRHLHHCRENQCTSVLVKYIQAPVHLVRSSILSSSVFLSLFSLCTLLKLILSDSPGK
jgi:ribosomal protein L30/L7E